MERAREREELTRGSSEKRAVKRPRPNHSATLSTHPAAPPIIIVRPATARAAAGSEASRAAIRICAAFAMLSTEVEIQVEA